MAESKLVQLNFENNTVQLVIFVGLIFRGLENSDNSVVLYFRGVPTLIT